ncbi:MAG: trypsin-like peptidase domain-containing protein, partial [Planctomycetota bacterium]
MVPDPEARWEIKPLQVTGAPDRLQVGEAGLSIGRDPQNELALAQSEFPTVSANHVRLNVRGGELVLLDLGSRNGTLVDGQPVAERSLQHGDVFQLGAGGPRFVALHGTDLDRTVTVTATAPVSAGRRSMGSETVAMVRKRLGIPAKGGVDQMMRSQQRRHTLAFAMLTLVVVAGGIGIYFWVAQLDANAAALEHELDTAIRKREQAWHQHDQRLSKALSDWEQKRTKLEDKRKELQKSLKQLQAGDQATAEQIDSLKGQLAQTKRRLQGYDPINLEQAKLREVRRVEKAVVLIEIEQTFVDEDSGKTLYIERKGGSRAGLVIPNFEDKGNPLVRRATGSGFCFSNEGWILTNAHVVLKKEDDEVPLGSRLGVVSEVEIKVVFTTTDKRLPARLVAWASDDDEDLALLKITPFAGMPCLPGIDTKVALPRAGTEVFVLGFPLGTEAMQEGQKVIASTFRGIVSRSVGSYLQVDAAVHPGASGGPLIDGRGRVLGVVVGMQ